MYQAKSSRLVHELRGCGIWAQNWLVWPRHLSKSSLRIVLLCWTDQVVTFVQIPMLPLFEPSLLMSISFIVLIEDFIYRADGRLHLLCWWKTSFIGRAVRAWSQITTSAKGLWFGNFDFCTALSSISASRDMMSWSSGLKTTTGENERGQDGHDQAARLGPPKIDRCPCTCYLPTWGFLSASVNESAKLGLNKSLILIWRE